MAIRLTVIYTSVAQLAGGCHPAFPAVPAASGPWPSARHPRTRPGTAWSDREISWREPGSMLREFVFV